MTEYDPIEALLQATGPRPAIPADRTDRVRRAVRAGWHDELARSARAARLRWGIVFAAAAVVVAAVVVGMRGFPPSPPPAAVPSGVSVERVVGLAWTGPQTPLAVGSILVLESQVTTGAGALAALRARSGHSVRLDGATSVRIESGETFALERGAIYVDSGAESESGAGIRIDTPLGAIEDLGTQFAARFDGALTVSVREGAVTVQTATERLVAEAGQALRIDPSGRVTRSPSPVEGPDWAWAETIAPMMKIEGRSLQEFLDWVARERGVRVRFKNAEIEGKAPGIVLKGAIDGMTLEQAAASVLATCGLSGRWEPGTLVVTR